MASFERFDLLLVKFPFSERANHKQRPALVLSNASFHLAHGHYALAMITTAIVTQWPSDVPVTSLHVAGLVAPSVVRLKLFTLSDELVLGRLGSLAEADRTEVQAALAQLLLA